MTPARAAGHLLRVTGPSHTPEPKRTPNLRVLVADDSLSFREILCAFLESLPGVELCGVASNGLDALQVAAQTSPDLVLMDLVMPSLGGCEATRRLKLGPQAPQVVLLSICGDDELQQATRLAGADGFLNKCDVGTRLPEVLQSVARREGVDHDRDH
jgi:DNA-binding NarL/FixJ family response regulator